MDGDFIEDEIILAARKGGLAEPTTGNGAITSGCYSTRLGFSPKMLRWA
jgi:hypothetical protein